MWEMLPLSTRQFSSTFLDFRRNSRGYEEEVRTPDRDAVKSLLSPPLLKNTDSNNSVRKCGFPQCHPFGNVMGDFVRHCTTVHLQPSTQSTGVTLPAFSGKFQGDNSLLSVDSLPRPDDQKRIIDIKMANSNFSANSVCDNRFMNEPQHEEPHIKPLTWYKKVRCSKETVSPSLTINFHLDVLKSVLHDEEKASRNTEIYNVDVCGDVCGKIAILHGFVEEGTRCISVVGSEVVGLYDYVEGMVQPVNQRSHPNNLSNKDTKDHLPSSFDFTVDLSEFLERCYHVLKASSLQTIEDVTTFKGHSPVAWLLTSPALGVSLDWQVHNKVLNCLKDVACKSNESQQVSKVSRTKHHPGEWCNILVVVDEYRCVETDIPQLEAYHLFTNGIVNLVNFDIN